MPRLTAEFNLSCSAEITELPNKSMQEQRSLVELITTATQIGFKAVMKDNNDGLFWVPFDVPVSDDRILIETSKDGRKLLLAARGSFTCKLREGVAPYLQSKKKEAELKLEVQALRIMDNNAKLHEIAITEFIPDSPSCALSWRLH